MPSPFPGMDPYLEDPELWPDVHANLITSIQELLNRVIRPRYVARVERRMYLADDDETGREHKRVSDVRVEASPGPGGGATAGGVAIAEPILVPQSDPVTERRVEVIEVATRAVVTVIEVLSPANKAPGSAGRTSFLEKPDEVLASPANWFEIDLLRAGTGHPSWRRLPPHAYLIYSSPTASGRPGRRGRSDSRIGSRRSAFRSARRTTTPR